MQDNTAPLVAERPSVREASRRRAPSTTRRVRIDLLGISSNDGDRRRRVRYSLFGRDVAELRRRLVGPQGTFLQFVQDSSEARVSITPVSSTTIDVYIAADSPRAVSRATALVADLVDAVRDPIEDARD